MVWWVVVGALDLGHHSQGGVRASSLQHHYFHSNTASLGKSRGSYKCWHNKYTLQRCACMATPHLDSFKVQAPPSERVRDRGVVIIDVQGQSAIVGRCEMLQRGERGW